MQQPITFITGNLSKAEQLERHLHLPVIHKKLDLPEIQSLDLAEIVSAKARLAFEQIGQAVLVEDTSLRFQALGKLPGPLIKWFLQELDNDGLCTLLNGYSDRSATAEVLFGYYDGVAMKLFDGEMSGTIAVEPRGDRGFGWDPIFVPNGWSKAWGEMDMEEQKQTSMRRIALKKLEAYIKG